MRCRMEELPAAETEDLFAADIFVLKRANGFEFCQVGMKELRTFLIEGRRREALIRQEFDADFTQD